MTKIQDVSGTAFIVAEYRAQENAEQNPIYRDPIVPLFLGERTRRAAERVAADFPPSSRGVRLRTRYFDDRLDEELGRGCQQVVIPGAGLDTRGVRKQATGVTYFEIDDADTLNFKKSDWLKQALRPRSSTSRATMSPTTCSGCFELMASTLTCRRMQFGKATQCI